MIQITYHQNGTQTIKRDGAEIDAAEWRKWQRRRKRLTGGVDEIVRSGAAPVADTDETHTRINRSGLSDSEKAIVAKRAKAAGLNEHAAYDPTLPGQTVYESRRQADEICAAAHAEPDPLSERQLHPALVERTRREMIAADPALATKDQRELEEQITEKHGLPKHYL